MGNSSNSEGTVVRIPKSLADRIRKRLAQSDFKNVDDYVAYVLNQVLDELEGQSQKTGTNVFSKEEQKDMEDRLRSLGYM